MRSAPVALFYCIVALAMMSAQLALGGDAVASSSKKRYGYEQTASDSCKFRCGQSFTMPCSCDVTCLVYRNCCEDMESECSHVMLESRQKFQDQLTAQLECTYNGYLFISTCPDIHTDMIGSGYSLEDSFNHNSTMDPIQFLYKTVLVTDLNSGLTYKNFNIFKCNAANDSTPLMWQSYIDHVHFNSNGILETNLQDTDFLLFKPPHETATRPARCIQESINTCIRDSIDNYTELNRKCNEFKSYVKLKETVIFDNVYCALCNEVNRSLHLSIVTKVYIKHNFNFAIIGTVNQSSLNLEALSDSASSMVIPWSTVACSYSKKPFTGDINCAIVTCAKGFRKRPYGQCNKIYSLLLAFPKEEIVMSDRELMEFPNFLQCFLSKFSHDVVKHRKHIDAYFDIRLEKTFYVTQLWLYDSASIISLSNDNMILNYFLHLKMAIATFKRYRNVSLKRSIPEFKKSDFGRPEQLLKTKDLLIRHMLLEKYFVMSYDGPVNASLVPICVDHYIDDIKVTSATEVPTITTGVPQTSTEVTHITTEVALRLFHCVYSEDLANELGEKGHPQAEICFHTLNCSGLGVHLIYSVLLSSIIMIVLTKH